MMPREGYPVKITVRAMKHPCHQGHKVGDGWLIKDGLTPGGMCANSFHSLGPTIRALRFGAELTWDKNKEIAYRCCPSRTSRLIWELRRLRQDYDLLNEPTASFKERIEDKRNPESPLKVQITFHSIEAGQCPKGHKVGDSWWVDEEGKTPEGLCKSAFNTLHLALNVFRYGGYNPWDLEKDTSIVCCPSATHRVSFKLKRIH